METKGPVLVIAGGSPALRHALSIRDRGERASVLILDDLGAAGNPPGATGVTGISPADNPGANSAAPANFVEVEFTRKPKGSCKTCHGTGNAGKNLKTGANFACPCTHPRPIRRTP